MLYCCSFSTNSGDVLNSVICRKSSILQSYNFVWVVGGLGWGKIKCGVLCRLVCWQTPLFNFAKRWRFVFVLLSVR